MLGAVGRRQPAAGPGRWAAIENPARRLRSALAELYGYYRANEAMLANVTRDAALVPALAEAMGEQARASTSAACGRRCSPAVCCTAGRARRAAAAIGLALAFGTWQRLTRDEGLADADAAKLMVKAIEAP